MAGIYPDGGVPAGVTVNAVNVPTVNCTSELFYSTSRCQPRFEPAQMNAMISEMLNVVSSAARTYDCSRLDNLALAVRALTADAIVNGCYTPDDAEDQCFITPVGWVEDDDGCGKFVRITSEPLPQGSFNYESSVVGAYQTNFTGAPQDRSARLEAQFNTVLNPSYVYEIKPPAPIILNVSQFCGLTVPGIFLVLDYMCTINYALRLTTMPDADVGIFQYGTALFVDNQYVHRTTSDHFALDNSRKYCTITDRGIYRDLTTTGGSLVLEIVPYVIMPIASFGSTDPANDKIFVDMAETFGTYIRRYD